MNYINQLLKQFTAMSLRERLLAIAAFLGVVYFVFDTALLRPQNVRAKALQSQVKQQESDLAAFNLALQALSRPGQKDPLAGQRAERDELRLTFARGEALLGNATADARLSELIRTMVAARPGLTLVSLKTVPVETFFQPSMLAPAAPAIAASGAAAPNVGRGIPTLYKHGVEVTVRGDYPAVTSYVQGLERNTKGIFWGNARLDVFAYPEVTLKLTVHTLSARPELPLG